MYGKCPECGADGVSRERRPNGNDTCANGHVYPSISAVHDPLGGVSTLVTTREIKGPLAIAVPNHQKAEDFAFLIGFHDDPSDQGVRVIPYAASALAFCGPGTRLFRGLVSIRPRETDGIFPRDFDHWVETVILPYCAPGCQRIVL